MIGRGGETIKNINNKTGAFVFIPKTCEPGSNMRVLTVSGLPEQIDMAKNEIEEIVNMVKKSIQSINLYILFIFFAFYLNRDLINNVFTI